MTKIPEQKLRGVRYAVCGMRCAVRGVRYVACGEGHMEVWTYSAAYRKPQAAGPLISCRIPQTAYRMPFNSCRVPQTASRWPINFLPRTANRKPLAH
jgi:hypothetical protein